MKKSISFILLLCVLFLFSCRSYSEKKFYSNVDNFVEASGTISSVEYSKETDEIFISFEKLTPKFADNVFSISNISGKQLKTKDIESRLLKGVFVEFTSAVAYFGDGYLMPIVSLTIDGEELLSFEDGYANFIQTF